MVTLHFPDLSHYQAGISLTGVPALIAKATQGSTFRDPNFTSFRSTAAQMGIPFCGYHWPDTSSIASQARNAYAVAGHTPMMWDAEAEGVTVARLQQLTTAYRDLGGVVHLCYLPRWWWERLGRPDLRPLEAMNLVLVSSNYPAIGYTENGPGWTPYGGVTPTIWQYTATKPLNGMKVDSNAYKGTAAQLDQVFKHGKESHMADDSVDYDEYDRDRVTATYENTDTVEATLAQILAKLDTLSQPVPAVVDPVMLEAVVRAAVRQELDVTTFSKR